MISETDHVLSLPPEDRKVMADLLEWAIEHRLHSGRGKMSPLHMTNLCGAVIQAKYQWVKTPGRIPHSYNEEQLSSAKRRLTFWISWLLGESAYVTSWLSGHPAVRRADITNKSLQDFRARWGRHLVEQLRKGLP